MQDAALSGAPVQLRGLRGERGGGVKIIHYPRYFHLGLEKPMDGSGKTACGGISASVAEKVEEVTCKRCLNWLKTWGKIK